MGQRIYIAIDLKSFYASVECVARELDPLKTNLVVADSSRTEKTICLAVSPSLKAYGIPGRARLFEVVQKAAEVNALRQSRAPGRKFSGSSFDADELNAHREWKLDYIVAPPRMSYYIECSNLVYNVYLKYIAPEDIHVYSIDEVFMDVTGYLKTYGCTPRELAMKMILDVLNTSGVTATAGIGTNLYLAKVAMDVEAKHIPPDEKGVRIAELDEFSYRERLWTHRPLTDFWRVGRGYARKLESHGLFTMGDVARCSVRNDDLLYRMFGVNAELLIDHAWGWEPCTISQVKAYKPVTNSVGSGQVLTCPTKFETGKLITREMTDMLVLDLVDRGLVTDQLTLTIGYDIENLKDPAIAYTGPIVTDGYGRQIPKHAHGTANLGEFSSSTRKIIDAVMALYDRIGDPSLLIRRLNLTANHVVPDSGTRDLCQQLDLFADPEQQEKDAAMLAREKRRQKAVLSIRKKYGKNAILKAMSYQKGATAIERNGQIGGHKA